MADLSERYVQLKLLGLVGHLNHAIAEPPFPGEPEIERQAGREDGRATTDGHRAQQNLHHIDHPEEKRTFCQRRPLDREVTGGLRFRALDGFDREVSFQSGPFGPDPVQ